MTIEEMVTALYARALTGDVLTIALANPFPDDPDWNSEFEEGFYAQLDTGPYIDGKDRHGVTVAEAITRLYAATFPEEAV